MLTSLDLEEELVKKIDECVHAGKKEAAILFSVPEDYLSAKGKRALEQLKKETAFVGNNRSIVITSILKHYFAGEAARLFKNELQERPAVAIDKPLTYSEQQFSIRRSAPSSYNAE